jgi:transposase
MYIRKTESKGKKKTYTNHLLVESVSTPKGPRQKTVCSLGDLSPRSRGEWLKLAHKVESALAGQDEMFGKGDPEVTAIVEKVRRRRAQEPPPRSRHRGMAPAEEDPDELVSVRCENVSIERAREGGPVHVGRQFWLRLGLDGILKEVGLSGRSRDLACAMALNRLVHQSSEHAMPPWIGRTALPDILGMDGDGFCEDSLYRNLDRLYPNRAAIESALVERERNLFHLDKTFFFYDLTSTYFEGQARGIEKAKRGYSRDKRPDCKQVVVGLAVSREGFPLAHEVFEGNTQDRLSLGDMLDILGARVGFCTGQTVVVDRGMAFEDNLKQITSRGLRYIVAARQSERDQWIGEFEDAGDFVPVIRPNSPWNEGKKKSEVRVALRASGDEAHVLCHSEGRTEKDRAIREKQEGRFLADLAKLEKRIREGRLSDPVKIGEAMGRLKERYPRVARYYPMEYDAGAKVLAWKVDEARRAKAEALDGCYLLKTDRKDLSAEDAWRIYVLLTRAEAAFRAMKSPLAERPIFHKVQRRVETHIFLCVLAYHLLVSIEQTLLDKGVHTSWATVREALKSHQVATVILPTDGGSEIHIRRDTTPEPEHVRIYDLLGVTHQIIRPRKTWVHLRPTRSDVKKTESVGNQQL